MERRRKMDVKQVQVGEGAKGSAGLALSAMQGACRIIRSIAKPLSNSCLKTSG
jgi:hypothetical protein